MTRTLLCAAAALLIATPSLAAPPVPPQPPEPSTETTVLQLREIHQSNGNGADIPADVRAKVTNCDGQKFEANATTGEAKDKKRTRIVLCGKKDATTAETAAMLESAVAKLEANQELPAENKAQILAQLKAKIAELKAN